MLPCVQEADYIPMVKEMLSLQRQYEKPQQAASAIAKQANKKPAGKSKAKAKAKA